MGRVRGDGHRVDAAGARRLRRADHGGADGRAHLAHRARHRRGAAAGAASDRPCAPSAVGARDGAADGWRSASARRTTGSCATCSASRTRSPPPTPATTSRCSTPRWRDPGRSTCENDTFTVHNPTVLGAETPMPVLVAALGPVMLQIAGELADGTVLWMADERAIGDHIAPKITKAAADAGRPAPRIVAGIPVCLCANSEIDAAKERANRILAEAETSPELPAAARPRRRPRRRRPLRGRRRGGDPGAVQAVRRRRCHRPVGAAAADRRQPRRADRVEVPHPRGDRRAARPSSMTAGPLAGIRILEVGIMLAGPYATMLLADLGAEVIKIEPPGGEISRQVSDSYFASLNRGKRSVCLDLSVRGRPTTAGRAGREVACAAGQPEAVGDPAARPHLRRAAAATTSGSSASR